MSPAEKYSPRKELRGFLRELVVSVEQHRAAGEYLPYRADRDLMAVFIENSDQIGAKAFAPYRSELPQLLFGPQTVTVPGFVDPYAS